MFIAVYSVFGANFSKVQCRRHGNSSLDVDEKPTANSRSTSNKKALTQVFQPRMALNRYLKPTKL